MSAITNRIDSVCKSDKVTEEILWHNKDLYQDPVTFNLRDQKYISIRSTDGSIVRTNIVNRDSDGTNGTKSALVIEILDESIRMMEFTVFHRTVYSDYMETDLWSTIKVRIICSASGFLNPFDAQPASISDVISYDRLMSGSL